MRRGRCVVECQPDFACHGVALAGHVNARIGITITERRKTVEHVVRAAIPEVAVGEDGVDDAGAVGDPTVSGNGWRILNERPVMLVLWRSTSEHMALCR